MAGPVSSGAERPGRIVDALDLAHPGRARDFGPFDFEFGHRRLQGNCEKGLLLGRGGARVACPYCQTAFTGAGEKWWGENRSVGEGRYVCYSLQAVTSRLCKNCDRVVAEEFFQQHLCVCYLSDRLPPETRADEASCLRNSGLLGLALPYRDEESSLVGLLQYWNGSLSKEEVAGALKVRTGRGLDREFLLRDLLFLAAGGRPFHYPPRAVEVVRDCRTLSEAVSLKGTYLKILEWLRWVLLQSAKEGRLSRPEFRERSALLRWIYDQAGASALVRHSDGLFGARSPVLREVASQYLASESRAYLLSRLEKLTSHWIGNYLLLDGTEALDPDFVSAFLVLEVSLGRESSLAAVTKCTLDEYRSKEAREEESGWRWRAAAAWGELLAADERLARAIDGYVRHIRHRHCPLLGSSAAGGPLFPNAQGGFLSDTSASREVFFKLAGGRSDDPEVRQCSLDHLKEAVVRDPEQADAPTVPPS